MKCTVCGKILPKEAVFCTECGNKLNSVPKRMSKGLKIGIIVTVSVVVVALIVTTIVLIIRNNSKEKQIEAFLENVYGEVFVNKNYEEYASSIYPSLFIDSDEIEHMEDNVYEMQYEIGYIKSVSVNVKGVKTVSEAYNYDVDTLEMVNWIKQKTGIKELYKCNAEIIIKGSGGRKNYNITYLILGKVDGKWKIIDADSLCKDLSYEDN